MKRIWIFLLWIFSFISIHAYEEEISVIGIRSITNPYKFAVGLNIGTDLGGAVPFPVSNVPGIIRAYPDINLSLGGKIAVPVTEHWIVGTEVTYKKISLEAKARVENQKVNKDNVLQYFTGTAHMSMAFTMLELPLLVKYNFGSSGHRLLGGPFFSYYLNSKFVTLPKKGFTGDEPDKVEGDGITGDGGVEFDFTPNLGNWNIGVLIGYEYEFINRFHIGLRIAMSFKDIFDSGIQYFDYKMLPVYGTVLLSYDLFRK
jgi:hypothetical protein